jgi:hypothetical protein
VRTHRCFGISVVSDLEFPGTWPPAPPDDDPTRLVHRSLGPWAGADSDGWAGVCDGERFVVARDAAGAHRFTHGGRALFELSPDHRRLAGDLSPERRTTGWWRALLDSVLFTVALLRGGEALHAGAVATDAGVVAIAGPSGAGKSTLLAHLVAEHGLQLVTDDVLFLSCGPRGVQAHPGPPLMTVPRAGATAPGPVLAELGDERWTAAPVAARPAPLRRIVVLDRHGGPRAAAAPEPAPFPTLMRLLMPFPRTPARQASRLALAAELAGSVELVRMRAELRCPVREVADLVLAELALA